MSYNHLQICRESIREVRATLSENYQARANRKIMQKIKRLDEWRYAKRVALYFAVKGEVDVNHLWKTAPLQGKFCSFPFLTEAKTLLFLPATPATTFVKNKYEIPEPKVDAQEAFPLERLDIIFVPLVAFDSDCNRLGMGGGYYDRTFAKQRGSLLVGLAYDFQKIPLLVPNPWDISLDMVVTPSKMYKRPVKP